VPQVTLQINGRSYAVGCAEGEQEHLVALARGVDAKVRALAGKLGAVGEARLLLLACLTLADELEEAKGAAGEARATGRGGRRDPAKSSAGGDAMDARFGALEQKMSERDGALAERLDAVAKRLAGLAERLPPP
jgi:cell division protein ZapA